MFTAIKKRLALRKVNRAIDKLINQGKDRGPRYRALIRQHRALRNS